MKWALAAKNNELSKFSSLNVQLKAKILQLNKKLDNLNTRKVMKNPENSEFLFQNTQKDDFLLLNSPNLMPNSIEFRMSSLKPEFSSMLNDISLYGANAFSSQIAGLDSNSQRKTAIEFITTQFLGFRDFSEKLNNMNIELFHLVELENVEELMLMIAKNMKELFKAEEIELWLEDSVKEVRGILTRVFIKMTGVLFTRDAINQEKRALKDSGLFKEVFMKKETVDCKKYHKGGN